MCCSKRFANWVSELDVYNVFAGQPAEEDLEGRTTQLDITSGLPVPVTACSKTPERRSIWIGKDIGCVESPTLVSW